MYLEENQCCIIPQDEKKVNVFFDQKAVISKVKSEHIYLTVLLFNKQVPNMYLYRHLRKSIYKSMTIPVLSEFNCFYNQGTHTAEPNTAQRVGRN